jgi:TonB family protein
MQRLILECAVRALLIALCTGAVLFLLRVKAARVRHAVWASVVAMMLALPVWTAWGPKAVVRVLNPAATPTTAPPTTSLEISATQQAPPPKPAVRSATLTWQNYLAGIYLLGFFALLARLAIGTMRAHQLRRRAANRDGRLSSHSCPTPVTVGWLNPTVILPEHWPQWPQAQLHAVLMHENEHSRWRDPLVQWLALLNRAIFWFHPLAWWLERRLSALSEEACDAAVLARGIGPFEYSEYLLQIARAMQQNGARLNLMGMAMPGPFLPQRIRRILQGRPAQRISRMRMASLAVACAMVSTVFTAGAMDHAQPVAVSKAPIVANLTPEPIAIQAPTPAPPKVLLAQAQRPNAVQPDGASIFGTVEDPSGSRVPGCLVVLHNQAAAGDQTARTNPTGLYRFASLAPGHYSIEFQMPGFAKLTKTAEIAADKSMRLDVQLSIGQASQTLTVIGKKPAAPETGPISVGGRVEAAKLLVHPDPIYSPELREQGIEGTVRIAAIISSDGVPVELKVLNTDQVDPRLTQAALDAVRQWRYQPTKLNEHPVSNATSIEVNFELGK